MVHRKKFNPVGPFQDIRRGTLEGFCVSPGHESKPVPPVNIPIPTKIGSKMGGELTYPKLGSQNGFDHHSHLSLRVSFGRLSGMETLEFSGPIYQWVSPTKVFSEFSSCSAGFLRLLSPS